MPLLTEAGRVVSSGLWRRQHWAAAFGVTLLAAAALVWSGCARRPAAEEAELSVPPESGSRGQAGPRPVVTASVALTPASTAAGAKKSGRWTSSNPAHPGRTPRGDTGPSRSRLRKWVHGRRGSREIAVTIDDGPHPAFTPKLLMSLQQYHAKATFFMVGRLAEQHPELVEAVVAAGHSLGNHTYNHADLKLVSQARVRAEVERCGQAISRITGSTPRLFRPPYSHYNAHVLDTVASLGYTLCLWSIHSGDVGRLSAQAIADRVLRSATGGSVILFHDGVPQTLKALPLVLRALQAKRYRFVTLDEMMTQDQTPSE